MKSSNSRFVQASFVRMTAASAIRFQALARKREVFDTDSEADRETLIDEVRCTKVVQFSKKGKCSVSKSVLQIKGGKKQTLEVQKQWT